MYGNGEEEAFPKMEKATLFDLMNEEEPSTNNIENTENSVIQNKIRGKSRNKFNFNARKSKEGAQNLDNLMKKCKISEVLEVSEALSDAREA